MKIYVCSDYTWVSHEVKCPIHWNILLLTFIFDGPLYMWCIVAHFHVFVNFSQYCLVRNLTVTIQIFLLNIMTIEEYKLCGM